jgi:hypothetical protein
MLRATCPDPALLQAYVDGTLFSRDVSAVEQHLADCERCTGIVSAMRQERDAMPASIWSRQRVAGVALVVMALAGIATWSTRSGSNDVPPSRSLPVTPPEPPAVATPPPAPITSPPPVNRPALLAKPRPLPTVNESAPPAEVSPAIEAQADGSVIVRGGRRSNRRVIWRARDLVIERSTDGGTTWASEYTTERPVRTGAFVSEDAVWLAGDNGLILRRTKNGWFGATPPAAGTSPASARRARARRL